MIEQLRERNAYLLSKCANKKDLIYLKLEVIRKLLLDDACFFKMNIDYALNILKDLGYKDKDALNIYKVLTSPNEYIKVFES